MTFFRSSVTLAAILFSSILIAVLFSLRPVSGQPGRGGGKGHANRDSKLDLADAIEKLDESLAALLSRTPVPEDIVNVAGVISAPEGSPEVLTLYTVPDDKWLILKDVMSSPVRNIIQLQGNQAPSLKAPIMGLNPQFTFSAGLAFPPGSQVGFQKQTAGNETVGFFLGGYLVSP